jgi:hypothetical protein
MSKKRIPLLVLLAPILPVIAGLNQAAENGFPSLQKMLDLKNQFFERAVHPETHLIYGRIDLQDPDRWKKTIFPTPESIRSRFCDDREVPNVSNCAISNGIFLGQLAEIYDATKDEASIRQAALVFNGLRSLARASKRKGFVARCLLPGDPTKAHLLNSSVDQYTFYVYGLYKYYHSPMCAEEDKRDIRQIMTEICTMIEEDGTILASNGIPAPVSDIEAIRSDRSSRILEAYLVAWDVTGDQHWRDIYLEKVRESNYGRLHSLLDPDKVRRPYMPRDLQYPDDGQIGAIWQTQYSLVPLVEIERDIALKATYLEAMRINARIVESSTRGHALPIIMFAQNRSVIAGVANPTEKQYLEGVRARSKALFSKDLTSREAMEVYWSGVARGVFKPQP